MFINEIKKAGGGENKNYLFKDGINLLGDISSTYWNIVGGEIYCSVGSVVTTSTITFPNKIALKKGQRIYIKSKIRNKGYPNNFQIVINAGSDINSQYLGTSLPTSDVTIDYSVYSMIKVPIDGDYSITFKATNGNGSWLWYQWISEVWIDIVDE